MLRITVELVPFGDEARAREIAVASIGNVGGSIDLGDYAYTLSAEASPLAPAVGHKGIVKRYRRHQPVWALVLAVLDDWAVSDNPGL